MKKKFKASVKMMEDIKRLMGITEGDLMSGNKLSISITQHLNDLYNAAETISHLSELSMKGFKKVSRRIKQLEDELGENPDMVSSESKVLMHVVRLHMNDINKAQERANKLLETLDNIMTGNYWPKR